MSGKQVLLTQKLYFLDSAFLFYILLFVCLLTPILYCSLSLSSRCVSLSLCVCLPVCLSPPSSED